MKKIQDFSKYTIKGINASDALKILMNSAKVVKKTESVILKHSVNRIVAKNIVSKIDVPQFDNAAVDGFGFNFNDLKKNIKKFKIVGYSKPGSPFKGIIKEGEAIKVFTGAAILPKLIRPINTILMKETCSEFKGFVKICNEFVKGQNIRRKAEDIEKGRVIIEVGRKIRTVDVGYLSSLGLTKINVYKKLNIGIYSTGDEINSTGKKRYKNKIYDSNMLSLVSMIEALGCIAKNLGVIPDDYDESKTKIFKSIKQCDLIITTGGISSSETDHIKTLMKRHGEIKFAKLSIKPGRPFSFAIIKKKPLLGLPGNPVAVIVVFLMFVVNFIKKMSGVNKNTTKYSYIPSSFEFKKKKNRKEWLRGTIIVKKKKIMLAKFKTEGSGILSSIFSTEGIIELEDSIEYINKGDYLKFFRYEDILN